MEYKRLTFRHKSVVDGTEQIGYTERIAGCYRASDMILERLAELEDKIEQGTLIELPCKVGDTVYCVYAASGIQEWEVTSIAIYDHDTILRLGHKGTNDYNIAWLRETGEYLFFTREEAEKKLKELQNG